MNLMHDIKCIYCHVWASTVKTYNHSSDCGQLSIGGYQQKAWPGWHPECVNTVIRLCQPHVSVQEVTELGTPAMSITYCFPLLNTTHLLFPWRQHAHTLLFGHLLMRRFSS